MKIIIIGSGIAGVIAQRALSNHQVEVFDTSEDTNALKSHSAIMRMRDKTLAQLLGVSLEEVTVYKAYCLEGLLHTKPSITANNLYSLKTHDSIDLRSIKDCGVKTRYLFKDTVRASKVHGGAKLKKIRKNIALFRTTDIDHPHFEVEFDYCISTIPMPTILGAANISYDLNFSSQLVNIYTAKLKTPSTVHQTIYFPGPEDSPYRITIQGGRIIAECMDDQDDMLWSSGQSFDTISDLARLVDDYFGISVTRYDDWEKTTQVGKLLPVDNNKRKALMVKLNKFNIYSLGRNAIWRSIRADHLIRDIEKIKHFINVSEEVREYESNIDSKYSGCSGNDNSIAGDKTN